MTKCPVCKVIMPEDDVCSVCGAIKNVFAGSGRKPRRAAAAKLAHRPRETIMTINQHREVEMYSEVIRGNDVGDFCDQLWANPASQDRAGAPSGLSPSVSGKAAHRISQEQLRDGGGNASCGNPPPTNNG